MNAVQPDGESTWLNEDYVWSLSDSVHNFTLHNLAIYFYHTTIASPGNWSGCILSPVNTSRTFPNMRMS